MRKILLVLLGCLVALSAVAEEEVLDIVERQTQKVKDECYKSAFPEEKMDKILSLTDDSLKDAEQKYAVCIEKNIFKIIDIHFSPEVTERMKKNLEKFRMYYRDFYWDLYNTEDNGTIGRMQNDAIYSRRLEDILYDVNLHFMLNSE